MKRDFIIVVGNQGSGKTVWTKQYCRALKRVLVFDPTASFPNVDFVSPPEEWIKEIVEPGKETKNFRYGTPYPEEVAMFGNAAYAASNCAFIVDECALIFDRGERCPDWARPLVFMGRHRTVSLVLIAQRAALIPVDLRSQASRIVSFRQTEPDDVNAITSRIGKQYRDALSTLPDLQCIDWEPGRSPSPVMQYPIRTGVDIRPRPLTLKPSDLF